MPQFITQATIRPDLDAFTRAYVECALWLMHDEDGDDCDAFDGELSEEAYTRIIADCSDFQASNRDALTTAEELGEDASRAGHDFWLTRNGHGAGFWDRGLGDVGDRLTDAAHAYGEADAYIGDDGKVYLS
jgi:hypothetical protein